MQIVNIDFSPAGATASSEDGGVISSWKEAQRQYREKVSQSDPIHWRQGNDAEPVSLVGGLDIRFVNFYHYHYPRLIEVVKFLDSHHA